MDDAPTWTTALVTGATGGIGRATAGRLAPRVQQLLVHGPEPESEVGPVLEGLRSRLAPGATLRYLAADYGSLADVARFADEVAAAGPVDLLVNNAGVPGPPTRQLSVDGNELVLQVNVLAPVALAARVLDERGGDGLRIVAVASATHLSATLDLDDLDLQRGYSPVAAYARSKLALVAHTCWLADHAPAGVEAVSVHPGVIRTGLLHAMFGIAGDPPEQAGRVVAAVAAGADDSGAYYDETRPAAPHPDARDPEVQRRLVEQLGARLAPAGLRAGPGPTAR